MNHMNRHGRIALCGCISSYNDQLEDKQSLGGGTGSSTFYSPYTSSFDEKNVKCVFFFVFFAAKLRSFFIHLFKLQMLLQC